MLILSLLLVFADAQADANNSLLQYGAVGAMLVLLLLGSTVGIIIWKPAADWLREQIRQLQALNSDLLKQVQTAVPALADASVAMRTMSDAVKEQSRELVELRREVADLRKAVDDLKRER